MREKVYDAEWDASNVRKQFLLSKTEYYKYVNRNTIVDQIFGRMMKHEVENEWKAGKVKNKNKITRLYEKWRKKPRGESENIRNVKYRDVDLEDIEVCDKNKEVISYGGVEISDNMREALTLNPKMMCYNKVDDVEIECEIEKGKMKHRYSKMSKDKPGEDNNESEENNVVLDVENKVIDYSKMRATDLPSCPRF